MAVEILGTGQPDGTSIAKATTEKVALYGGTPVVQASHIADIATDANGTAIAAAVNAILVVLENLGANAKA